MMQNTPDASFVAAAQTVAAEADVAVRRGGAELDVRCRGRAPLQHRIERVRKIAGQRRLSWTAPPLLFPLRRSDPALEQRSAAAAAVIAAGHKRARLEVKRTAAPEDARLLDDAEHSGALAVHRSVAEQLERVGDEQRKEEMSKQRKEEMSKQKK